MKRRSVFALPALVIALSASPAAQADDKLAVLIPNLFGSRGLIVDSEARLPDGSTHSAHFNSGFQAQFTQFNVSLASQIAAVPLPSPASGFTFTLDPALGVFTRTTQSFGSILSERAETIGKGRLSMGYSFQRFTFDSLEGVDLDALPAVFTHDDAQLGGGRIDVVTTQNDISLQVAQSTFSLNYGLGNRVDVGLAVPVASVDLAVSSEAVVQRLGTADSPATHFFAGGAGFGNKKSFSQSGSATGIGDLVVRLKAHALKASAAGLALGLDARLPTGDEMDLLGSGAFGLKPFVTFSHSGRVFSPHATAGYQWNGDSVLAGNAATGTKASLPDQWLYEAGMDIGVTSRFTLALDVIGRHVVDSPRLSAATFRAANGAQFPDVHFAPASSFSVVNGAAGLKLNLFGRFLLDANLLVKLNEAGLRDRLTPLVGIEYAF
jgi:hypothetical protein